MRSWHLGHKSEPACGIPLWSGEAGWGAKRLTTSRYDDVNCERCRVTRLFRERKAEGRWKPDYLEEVDDVPPLLEELDP